MRDTRGHYAHAERTSQDFCAGLALRDSGFCSRLRFARKDAVDRAPQLRPVDRLREMFGKSRGRTRRHIFIRAESTQRDAAQAVIRVQKPHQLDTRPIRQADITDHEIELRSARELPCSRHRSRVRDFKPRVLQDPPQHARGIRMILDQQN